MATEKREEEKEEVISKNFIEQEIEKDLAEGVYNNIMTRFPPEPTCILDMQSRSCSIRDWQKNIMEHLIFVLMIQTRQKKRKNL